MGIVRVPLELVNFADEENARRGLITEAEVRRCTLDAIVDTGASQLVLPEKVGRQLGLTPAGDVPVQYADGRRARRPLVRGVLIRLMGRSAMADAVLEPSKDYALLGQIPLESMDLHVDCKSRRLMPNPESPDAPLFEM